MVKYYMCIIDDKGLKIRKLSRKELKSPERKTKEGYLINKDYAYPFFKRKTLRFWKTEYCLMLFYYKNKAHPIKIVNPEEFIQIQQNNFNANGDGSTIAFPVLTTDDVDNLLSTITPRKLFKVRRTREDILLYLFLGIMIGIIVGLFLSPVLQSLMMPKPVPVKPLELIKIWW